MWNNDRRKGTKMKYRVKKEKLEELVELGFASLNKYGFYTKIVDREYTEIVYSVDKDGDICVEVMFKANTEWEYTEEIDTDLLFAMFERGMIENEK